MLSNIKSASMKVVTKPRVPDLPISISMVSKLYSAQIYYNDFLAEVKWLK